MYYCATTILRMTEQIFWQCTPRKLWALINVHIRTMSDSKNTTKKPTKMGFIDQVL